MHTKYWYKQYSKAETLLVANCRPYFLLYFLHSHRKASKVLMDYMSSDPLFPFFSSPFPFSFLFHQTSYQSVASVAGSFWLSVNAYISITKILKNAKSCLRIVKGVQICSFSPLRTTHPSYTLWFMIEWIVVCGN